MNCESQLSDFHKISFGAWIHTVEKAQSVCVLSLGIISGKDSPESWMEESFHVKNLVFNAAEYDECRGKSGCNVYFWALFGSSMQN